MGLCWDTILVDVHNTATSAITLTTGLTTNSGDSLNVRSFDAPDWAMLVSEVVQGSGAQQARLTSPRLHDNVTGFTFQATESPAEYLFPPEIGQPLYSVDALQLQMAAAASSDTIGTLGIYYKNVQGIAADLRNWSDIKPNIINYKTVEVAVTSSATIGAWVDTPITTTENQLKADYRYALLGFQPSAALGVIGLKGPATGNLRICAPGATATYPLTDYFIFLSQKHGQPMIPVFKANDRFNTYVSCAANTASVAANVQMILAQLPK
jgi:hypothetical protein